MDTNAEPLFQVWVLFGSNCMRLKVKKSDKIHSLKTRVRQLEGISPDCMTFHHSENPQVPLEGNCTLADYGIVGDSFLLLKIKNMVNCDEMEIDLVETATATESIISYYLSVMRVTGEILTLEVNSYNTVGDLKALLMEKVGGLTHQQKLFFESQELINRFTLADYCICGESRLQLVLSRESLKIFIKTLKDGMITGLDLASSDTIGMVKAQIDDKEGIPVETQTLFFDGKMVSEDFTLAELRVTYGSTLQLLVATRSGVMQIFVKTFTGRTMSLEVRDSDTVGSVKIKIVDEFRGVIRPYRMKLFYRGRMLDNGMTLSHYNIHRNSTLNLCVINRGSLKVTVKALSTGKMVKTFYLKSSDTISKLKALLEDSEGIPQEQQLLLFDGKQLDGHEIFANYYFQEESTVHLMPLSKGKMQILVRMPEKATVLEIESSDTIGHLKANIQELELIPRHQPMKLVYNGKELDGCCKISDYNIHWNSVVHLMPVSAQMQITLMSETGNTRMKVKIGRSETVGQLKAKICRDRGFIITDLLFNGNLLDDRRSFAYYDIKDGSTLEFHQLLLA